MMGGLVRDGSIGVVGGVDCGDRYLGLGVGGIRFCYAGD